MALLHRQQYDLLWFLLFPGQMHDFRSPRDCAVVRALAAMNLLQDFM
jgi:hypothetical protein